MPTSLLRPALLTIGGSLADATPGIRLLTAVIATFSRRSLYVGKRRESVASAWWKRYIPGETTAMYLLSALFPQLFCNFWERRVVVLKINRTLVL